LRHCFKKRKKKERDGNESKCPLQSLTRRTLQQEDAESWRKFQEALALLLQGDPDRLITVDETHKDHNTARRRRGWGRRNSGGVISKEWYTNCVWYTLIAAADINGFIECACETVDRNELSEEGAAGTVDREEYYTRWVKEKLCPTLGRYVYGEPRSVVLLHNASTHMIYAMIDAIRATGALIIYAAPYSPDLNPIENCTKLFEEGKV
jgi:hypothetical protein